MNDEAHVSESADAVVTCPRCGESFRAASLGTVPLEIERHRMEKHAAAREAG